MAQRNFFLYGDRKRCFLVTLLIQGRTACAWPLPSFGLIFSWKVRSENPVPQIIAQDIVLADDETCAREQFFTEFWENEIACRHRKRSTRDIRALARIIVHYYRKEKLPTGLHLDIVPCSPERISSFWSVFLGAAPKLPPLRIGYRPAPP